MSGVATRCLGWLLLALGAAPLHAATAPSVCHGRPGAGNIEHAVQLPAGGANFAAYSDVGVRAGRTYLHERIAAVVLAAYASLRQTDPDTRFVYGETGLANGGPIAPHHTHQNGLSIDFMVPVRDAKGRSVRLPGDAAVKYGYGIEFDETGRAGDLTIDFDAMADHLLALMEAARRRQVGIALVIFDQSLLRQLYKTARGKQLEAALPWMKGEPWVRHDEHYHIDFSIPCRP